MFTYLLEAAGQNLCFKNFLAGANMFHRPIRTFAFDTFKVDKEQSPAWFERRVKRTHGLQGKLKVMIGVADIGNIHRRWFQLG